MGKTSKMVILLVIISFTQMFLFSGCKPEEFAQLPEVATGSPSNIGDKVVVVTGTVLSDGGAEILDQGVILDNVKISSTEKGVGPFSVILTNLSPNTDYSVKAYATNNVGTAFGSNVKFKTDEKAWSVKTLEATNITVSSATLNALVKASSLVTSITFEYGATSSYGSTVIVATNIVVKNDTTVSINLDHLSSSTTFHYRIKAVNSIETFYGLDKQFTTKMFSGFEIPGCEIRDLEVDGSGNVYVVGIFQGVTTKQDAFVARFNSNGELVWRKDIVTKDYDYPSGGIIVVDDVVYVNVNRNDVWGIGGGYVYVDAYDCQTGDLKWSTKLKSDESGGVSLTVSEDGYIYGIAGSTTAVLDKSGKIIKSHSSDKAGFASFTFMNGAIFGGGSMDIGQTTIVNVALIRRLDKDFNKIFDQQGTETSSYSCFPSIISFPADSLIIVSESFGNIIEQITPKSSVVCYRLHKDGLGLDLVWKKEFSNKGNWHISLKKCGDNSFYVFNPAYYEKTIDGTIKMNLSGQILWTASPKKNGNIAVYDGKVFLADGGSKLTIYN